MSERLGVYEGSLVVIVESTSGLDETIFPLEKKFQAKLGPADDAEVVVVDPNELTITSLEDTGKGSYKVGYESGFEGSQSGTIYIAKP